MAEETRIVFAEDQPIFRDGLRAALAKARTIKVVGEASDGVAALAHIRSARPDVAILDIGLPQMNGFAIVRTVRQEQIPVEIVFLTVHQEDEMIEEALALGVKGYLLKECTEAELLQCITAVASGMHYGSAAMTTYLAKKSQRIERFARETPGLRLLTPRERLIVRLIAQHKTSKEIAREFGISRKTVDQHRSNICEKLGLRGQYALLRFAIRYRNEL